jgi:hypothetical protein
MRIICIKDVASWLGCTLCHSTVYIYTKVGSCHAETNQTDEVTTLFGYTYCTHDCITDHCTQ